MYLPWAQLFPSWGQHRFLQSSSARMWYCSQYIGGVCIDRLGYMPAANLDIHSLMAWEWVQAGFLKLYFNGFMLISPSERAHEREKLLISIYHVTEYIITPCQTVIEFLGRFQLGAQTSRSVDDLPERMTGPHDHSLLVFLLRNWPERSWNQTYLLVCFCDVATGNGT